MKEWARDSVGTPMAAACLNAWYVVETAPKGARLAAQSIRELGIEIYLPEYLRCIKHGGKTGIVRRPLFQGYLFVSFAKDHPRWPAIFSRRGVRGMICGGDRLPKPVPMEEMEIVRKVAAEYVGKVCNYEPLSPDQSVLIIEGAFAGRLGEVRWCDDKRERVGVAVSGLKIELDRDKVEAA